MIESKHFIPMLPLVMVVGIVGQLVYVDTYPMIHVQTLMRIDDDYFPVNGCEVFLETHKPKNPHVTHDNGWVSFRIPHEVAKVPDLMINAEHPKYGEFTGTLEKNVARIILRRPQDLD